MAIAEVELVCAECGKKFRHRAKCYNRRDANKYEEWAAYAITMCPECYKKHKQEEERTKTLQEAVAWAQEFNLPELKGTEKQVAWAEIIRYEAAGNLPLSKAGNIAWQKEYERVFLTVDEARIWIEYRDKPTSLVDKINNN